MLIRLISDKAGGGHIDLRNPLVKMISFPLKGVTHPKLATTCYAWHLADGCCWRCSLWLRRASAQGTLGWPRAGFVCESSPLWGQKQAGAPKVVFSSARETACRCLDPSILFVSTLALGIHPGACLHPERADASGAQLLPASHCDGVSGVGGCR